MLITEKAIAAFDLSLIGRGDLLWGRHRTWEEGKSGFVTSATEEQLTVQYHSGIGTMINYFVIPVSEAAEGQWEIRWSKELLEIREYGIAGGSGEGDGIPQMEGGKSGDTGRTNS